MSPETNKLFTPLNAAEREIKELKKGSCKKLIKSCIPKRLSGWLPWTWVLHRVQYCTKHLQTGWESPWHYYVWRDVWHKQDLWIQMVWMGDVSNEMAMYPDRRLPHNMYSDTLFATRMARRCNSEFNRTLKEASCHLKQTKPFTPWLNAAERGIKELKKGSCRKLIKSCTPKRLWND